MKRLIAVALVLCLFAPCADAEKFGIDNFTFEYNISAQVTGTPKLVGGGYTFNGKVYQWHNENGDKTGFIVNEKEKIDTGFCNCASEENIGDFLSRCAAMAITIDCIDDISALYTTILDQYFTLKAGFNTKSVLIKSKVAMHLYKSENGVYVFLINNTELQ